MSRVQLALNVDDLDESIAFYSKLFRADPAKVRPGYANFAIADPPLKLVLIENAGQGGSVNHLGVEVPDTSVVDQEQIRLTQAGLISVDERGTTCCYAKQDKFWVEGSPDGERWEIYTVLSDSETFAARNGRRPSKTSSRLRSPTVRVGRPPGSVWSIGCGATSARRLRYALSATTYVAWSRASEPTGFCWTPAPTPRSWFRWLRS